MHSLWRGWWLMFFIDYWLIFYMMDDVSFFVSANIFSNFCLHGFLPYIMWPANLFLSSPSPSLHPSLPPRSLPLSFSLTLQGISKAALLLQKFNSIQTSSFASLFFLFISRLKWSSLYREKIFSLFPLLLSFLVLILEEMLGSSSRIFETRFWDRQATQTPPCPKRRSPQIACN